MSGQEIELRLKVENKEELVKKLLKLGAKFKGKKKQTDILFDSKYFTFGDWDQALRLRTEVEGKKTTAGLAFKGTPTHTEQGHKIRDEFETEADGDVMRKILNSIGFWEADVIEKERENYEYKDLNIVIDTLEFGTYVEFEGKSEDIEELRKKLGLEKAKPVKEGYVALKRQWKKRIDNPGSES